MVADESAQPENSSFTESRVNDNSAVQEEEQVRRMTKKQNFKAGSNLKFRKGDIESAIKANGIRVITTEEHQYIYSVEE